MQIMLYLNTRFLMLLRRTATWTILIAFVNLSFYMCTLSTECTCCSQLYVFEKCAPTMASWSCWFISGTPWILTPPASQARVAQWSNVFLVCKWSLVHIPIHNIQAKLYKYNSCSAGCSLLGNQTNGCVSSGQAIVRTIWHNLASLKKNPMERSSAL